METTDSPIPANIRPRKSVDNPIADHLNPCFIQDSICQPDYSIRSVMLVKKRAKQDIYLLENRLKRLYEEDLKVSRQIQKIKADRNRLEALRLYRYKVRSIQEDQYKLQKKIKDNEAAQIRQQKNLRDKLITTERIRSSRSETILRKSVSFIQENAMQMKLDYLYSKRFLESQLYANKHNPTTQSPYTFNFSAPLVYQRNKEEASKIMHQNQKVEDLLERIKEYKSIEDNLSKKLAATQEERQRELERIQDLSLSSRSHIRSSSQIVRSLTMTRVQDNS
jgi:hypothetical protein